MTEYCRKIGTTEIYIKTPYLMARGDMEDCAGPTNAIETTQDLVAEKTRLQQINEIIKTIDPATFSPPAFGRPAMPKITVVSKKAGFKVTHKEIIEAMETL